MRTPTRHERRFARQSGSGRAGWGQAATLHTRAPRSSWGRDARGGLHRRNIKLSILMPVYNEAATIEDAVDAVLSAEYPCEVELIIVDDGSRDGTSEKLKDIDDERATVHRHPRNFGKGAALHTAAAVATGTHILPFDADLEYSPADIPPLLEPVINGRCDVVFGTRLFGANTMYLSYRHAMGNRFLTFAANLLYDAYLSDMHTCLKLMPLQLFELMNLRENGFGLDTEITAKILQTGMRPFEVPVSYHSRSFAHGKKISWHHGLECLWVLFRVRLTHPRQAILVDAAAHAPAPETDSEHGEAGAGQHEFEVVGRRVEGDSAAR